MGSWFASQILNWLMSLVYDGVENLWREVSDTFLVSPDVTGLPQVQTAMATSLVVVDASYGLAIVVAGVTVMVGGVVQVRHTVGDLLPRLVVGFVASHFAEPLCSTLIDTVNALTRALTGETVTTDGTLTQMMTVVGTLWANKGMNALILAVIGLLLAVLTGMLLCGWITRLGLLIILVGLSPIALACHGLPHTEAVAKLWWRSILGCLGVVTLQAFALYTSLSVFRDQEANLPILGLSTDPNSLLNLLVVVCLLWATVKIPGLTRRLVMSTGHTPNPVGALARMFVVGQVTRLLPTATRAVRRSGGARTGRVVPRPGAPASTRAGGYRPSIENAVISYWRPRLPRPARATATSTGATSGVSPSGTSPTRPRPDSGGGGGTGGGPGRPPAPRPKPVIPAGVNPATAVPRTRPAWQTRAQQTTPPPITPPVTRTRSVPPRVPPGVTPATATPRHRPTQRS